MRWTHTERSKRDYRNAPVRIQHAFEKQVRLLALNLHHPSLRAKKYDQSLDVWQARVNREWRFYFRITGDTYQIIAIISHPK
jgi:hypothetical protein